MSEEVEFEAIPGVPGNLPDGERVLWQGKPQWKALARNTFKVRWLAAYFAMFAAVRFVFALEERQGAAGALQLLLLGALASACLGVLCLMAWLNARATIYTLTTRRLVLRIGVALPMTWNLPFKRLAAADLLVRKEGDGDISIQLKSPDRIAWLQLWPHTQPWHFVKARPTLRTIAEPARVAGLLADAMQSWAAAQSAPVVVSDPEVYAAPAKDRAADREVIGGASVAAEAGH